MNIEYFFKNNIIYRFDLIIKYLYVKWFLKNYKTVFFKNLYENHILTFNGGNEENKKNIDDFVNSFNKLIIDLKKNGFNNKYPIPIYDNTLITNGAHRLSICYFFKIIPKTIVSKPLNLSYNYFYFKNKDKRKFKEIPQNLLDYTILEGIKINNDLKAIILFPGAIHNESFIDSFILKKYKNIFYKKKLNLTINGLSNLIKELYRGEEWIGGIFPKNMNSNGKLRFVMNRVNKNQEICIYILSESNIENIKKMKEEIRKKLNDRHCIHTTDNNIETFRVSSCLLNKNSINYLNYYKDTFISDKNKKSLIKYFKKIEDDIKYREDFCLTSSIILEMYGLREAKDLDYLNLNNVSLNIKDISCHKDKWLKYYHINRDDIILNPDNYFYFNGYKFATLDIVKNMKEIRNELKDINDIKLINLIKT